MALCISSFLLGRNLSPLSTRLRYPANDALREIDALRHEVRKLEIINSKMAISTATELKCPEPVKCIPEPEPAPQAPTSQAQDSSGVVFDDAWIADPDRVMKTFNSMCKLIMDHNKKESRHIGVGVIMFCYAHVLTYKRDYNYKHDSIENNRGYYFGTDWPPYQMDMFQYWAVLSTIASIPSKHIKDQLEQKGKDFQDSANNYSKFLKGSHASGPRVLFWGCGADTPLHAHVMEYLGGNITFIDNSKEFQKVCKESHPDIRLIQPDGTSTQQTAIVENSVPPDGSGLDVDDKDDPLTASQWMSYLDDVEKEDPWDIIVVDGPGGDIGRSQPLYVAKRLAQSYGPNHYTHIFLHDAKRVASCTIANAIMGHDPQTYLGNTLPRKGLKHWRIPGRNRILPETKSSK